MANRNRPIRLQLWANEMERDILRQRMQESGINDFGEYARRMLLNGIIIVPNYDDLKKLIRQVSGVAINVNQITRRINETRRVYPSDLDEVRNNVSKIYDMVHEYLEIMQRLDKAVIHLSPQQIDEVIKGRNT